MAEGGRVAARMKNAYDGETVLRYGSTPTAALRELTGVVARWGRGREDDRPAALSAINGAKGRLAGEGKELW